MQPETAKLPHIPLRPKPYTALRGRIGRQLAELCSPIGRIGCQHALLPCIFLCGFAIIRRTAAVLRRFVFFRLPFCLLLQFHHAVAVPDHGRPEEKQRRQYGPEGEVDQLAGDVGLGD